MNNCTRCGSHSINHHLYGRDGTDVNLCDVCYWRKRAAQRDALQNETETQDLALEKLCRERDALTAQNRDLMRHLQMASDREVELTAEVARLRDRLEVSDQHAYNGIDTRDETIRMLEAEVARLRGALEEVLAMDNECRHIAENALMLK